MKLLAIDPSIHNVGMAFYDTKRKESIKTCIHHPPKLNIQEPSQRMVLISANIWAHVKVFAGGRGIEKLVIEYPNWQPSTKGKIAAQMGYTLDLACMAGYLAEGLGVFPWNVYLPTPTEWKGNVPKAATKHRVEKQFGMLQISEHEFDAIGLILWLIKKLNLDFPSKVD